MGDANTADGYSSGDALRAIEEVAKEVLPDGYTIAYSGYVISEKATSGAGIMPLYWDWYLYF